MHKWKWSYFKLGLFISIFLSMIIPSMPAEGGILKYRYGLPFSYITIYQRNKTSGWLLNDFFCGNAGIVLNPVTIIINAAVMSFIIAYLIKLLSRVRIEDHNKL